jgi:DNA (cytosine-5)-methyltransferase 1
VSRPGLNKARAEATKGARDARPRAAEFFAGIGLVRRALEDAGFAVVFANDIEAKKRDMYAGNFDASDFICGDVREVRGAVVPEIELATASFPCTDLSLAGNRAGLAGVQSSMFWEFARVLGELGPRRPRAVLLENVPSFATSHGGGDLRDAIGELNALGYSCDLFVLDARRFVPQSRPRLFIVGASEPDDDHDWCSELRPQFVRDFASRHSELRLHARRLRLPPMAVPTLADVVERLAPADGRWWPSERVLRFSDSLSPIQADRLARLRRSRQLVWASAYRRTRRGRAVWEIRDDLISGCLRTARGGSSRQAVVQGGRGQFRVRWMTPREYARLQGAPDYKLDDAVTVNQALFGFGDAVCVPVVTWIAQNYLLPVIARERTAEVLAVG